jgi:hypothetical protein
VKNTFCSLIVVSNESPTVYKLRISRFTARYIAIAGLVSCLATVSLSYHFPAVKHDDAAHQRLQMENRALELENKNVQVRAQQIETELAGLEQLTKRITELIETE